MHRGGRNWGRQRGKSIELVCFCSREKKKKKTEKKNKDKISLPLLTPFARAPSLNYSPKQALKDAGVDEVVLAINYQPQVSLFRKELKLQKKNEREEKSSGNCGRPLSVAPKPIRLFFFLARLL